MPVLPGRKACRNGKEGQKEHHRPPEFHGFHFRNQQIVYKQEYVLCTFIFGLNFYIEFNNRPLRILAMRTQKFATPFEMGFKYRQNLPNSSEDSDDSSKNFRDNQFNSKYPLHLQKSTEINKNNKLSSQKSSIHLGKGMLKEQLKNEIAKGKKPYQSQKKSKKDKTKTTVKVKTCLQQKKERKNKDQIVQKVQKIQKPKGKQKRKENKLVIDLNKKSSNGSSIKATQRAQANKGQGNYKLKQLPSFREYCIIKGMFVPLQSTSDRKCLDKMFVDTACTSPEVSHNRFLMKNHEDSQAIIRVSMDKFHRHVSNFSQIGIETMKTELAHYQVLVKAAQEDIGVQYSDRFSLKSNRREANILKELKDNAQLKLKEMQSESVGMKQAIQSSRSSLLQMMMKLQTLQLDQNELFQELNHEQKRHFRLVFQSLITKMKSPRITAPPPCSRQELMNQIQQLKYGPRLSPVQTQSQKQELQHLLMMRESRQNNLFNMIIRSEEHVDTSMLAVTATVEDILCYAQMNCEEALLQTLNNLYGLSYTDKYRYISKLYSQYAYSPGKTHHCISSFISLEIIKRDKILKALPEDLFACFMKELTEQESEQISSNERIQCIKENLRSKIIKKDIQTSMENRSYLWIHNKAIFDCINQFLLPYRPFYPTKGDPFPWTLSPLKCLTFYSIDSESLETVIEQVRQKISKTIKFLCGIHVQSPLYKAENYAQKEKNSEWNKDIVFGVRREKLSRAIVDQQCQNVADPYLELEIQTTCILHQISQQICSFMMNELSFELLKVKTM